MQTDTTDYRMIGKDGGEDEVTYFLGIPTSSFWYLLGWFFYVSGSIGYVVLDLMSAAGADLSTETWNILYTTFAVVFLVDSVFYFLGWSYFKPKPFTPDTGFYGEFYFLFAAILYVVSSGLLFLNFQDVATLPVGANATIIETKVQTAVSTTSQNLRILINTITYAGIQSAIQLAALLIYLFSALNYNSAYHSSIVNAEGGSPSYLTDVYFWGEALNTIPSIGYVCTAFAQLFSIITISTTTPSLRELVQSLSKLLSTIRSVNLAFDILFLIDSFIYTYIWFKELYQSKNI